MKKKVLGILIASTLMQSATPALAGNDKEAIGTLVGGLLGAAAGSQVNGKDRTAAIIIGAIAGAAIGNVVGRELDEDDRYELGRAQRDCFRGDVGRRYDWDGRNRGRGRGQARGSFTSIREGYNARTGEYCREYVSEIYANGRQERTTGVACSRPDGSWYESRTEEINYGRRDDRRDDRWDGRDDRRGRQDDNWRNPPRRDYGATQINGITRQTGGQWYRLTLEQPMSLSDISIRVLRANVKLHDVSLVTRRGQRLSAYDLIGARLSQGASIQGRVNTNDRITTIDIRAESFGAYADIEVSARSYDGNVRLYSDN